MKKLFALFLFFISVIWICLFNLSDWKFSINSEWAKFYKTEPYYKSYTILYSHGKQWDGKKWKNLWKKPTFHHMDLEKFLKATGAREIE